MLVQFVLVRSSGESYVLDEVMTSLHPRCLLLQLLHGLRLGRCHRPCPLLPHELLRVTSSARAAAGRGGGVELGRGALLLLLRGGALGS